MNKGAALISTMGKTPREIENSKLCKKKDKYVQLEPLYEPGFKSFSTLKREKLASWSWSYLSSNMVLVFISLYIKRRNKDWASICKYPN